MVLLLTVFFFALAAWEERLTPLEVVEEFDDSEDDWDDELDSQNEIPAWSVLKGENWVDLATWLSAVGIVDGQIWHKVDKDRCKLTPLNHQVIQSEFDYEECKWHSMLQDVKVFHLSASLCIVAPIDQSKVEGKDQNGVEQTQSKESAAGFPKLSVRTWISWWCASANPIRILAVGDASKPDAVEHIGYVRELQEDKVEFQICLLPLPYLGIDPSNTCENAEGKQERIEGGRLRLVKVLTLFLTSLYLLVCPKPSIYSHFTSNLNLIKNIFLRVSWGFGVLGFWGFGV